MGIGIEIVAVLITSLLGGFFPLLKDIVRQHLKKSKAKGAWSKTDELLSIIFNVTIEEPTSYKQRLANTLDMLKTTFAEVDKATFEFTELMKEKERNIELLESRLTELSHEETTLKQKVETLQKVPIEALSHFEEILKKGDKRSAARDYILFVLGALLSVIVTLILKHYYNI